MAAQKVVPSWALWVLVLGFLLPGIGYFWLDSFNPALGFWVNVSTQDVAVPFLYGQNPIDCFSEAARNMTSAIFSERPVRTLACQTETLIPYRYFLMLSVFFIVLGIYGYINPEELANKWPTDWNVFNPDNAKPTEKKASKYDPSKEEPIKPNEGGF